MEKHLIESYSEEEVTTAKKIVVLECGKVGLTKEIAESKKRRMRPNIFPKNTKDILDILDVVDREKGGKLLSHFIPTNPQSDNFSKTSQTESSYDIQDLV